MEHKCEKTDLKGVEKCELNREQIIKGLECCTFRDCASCPYYLLHYTCRERMNSDLFVLIKELTAQNERLRGDVAKEFTCVFGQPHKVSDCPINDEIAKVKADTVRQMQERMKEAFKHHTYNCRDCIISKVDQIAKEMLEGE